MSMGNGYVLYNPLAGNGKCEADARLLEMFLPDEVRFFDMTRITNYTAFIGGMEKDDYLIVVGGDGTLNRFVNDTASVRIEQELLYFPVGTSNDFAKDLGKEVLSNPFPVTQYLKNLPSVEIKGKHYRFLNGVGFGIDGYCCQIGDEKRKTSDKEINYVALAVKGLWCGFNARNAVVTVDGKEHTYEKVWMAPTMHGRFYGGGMMPVPDQNRLNTDGSLSLVLFHGADRLRMLCVFPRIFSGKHVKHTNMVTVHSGHEITVKFDRPTPLQIDGESILHVTSYTARSAQYTLKKNKECVSV